MHDWNTSFDGFGQIHAWLLLGKGRIPLYQIPKEQFSNAITEGRDNILGH